MASFFSTLFGGGSERDAANRNRGEINRYNTQSLGTLDNAYGRSTDAINTYGNNANSRYQDTYNLYSNNYDRGIGQLDSALSNSRSSLERGRSNYDSLDALAKKYGSATSLLLDSLGVNGSEGNQRATSQFQAGPGYQWQLEQGQQALERSRARRGMLNSGNTDVDTMNYSQGLANQTYGDWQDRLGGFREGELSATSSAASGRSAFDKAISDLYQNDVGNRLTLGNQTTSGQAGANSGMAGVDQWMGNSLNNLSQQDATNRLGVYGNTTSGNINANNLQSQGESQGARNLWNAGMQAASLLASGGMSGLGGGSGSSFFSSLFGGGGR